MTLFESQRAILDAQRAHVIFDVGAQDGNTTVEYLDGFPNATVYSFEPDVSNYVTALERLAPYGARVHLLKLAIADAAGSRPFHVNSHNGTHSLLPIGEQRYWEGYASTLEVRTVETDTVDAVAERNGLRHINILKMDIQGGELNALKGAASLLKASAIDLIALEVEFQELYSNQPLFWDIGAYLQTYQYAMYGLFDCHHSSQNSNVLSWADAIFLSPRLLHLPEWSEPKP